MSEYHGELPAEVDYDASSRQMATDAGANAAERIRTKSSAYQKAKRVFNTIVGGILALAIVIIASAGYYAYSTKTVGHFTDSRPCSWKVGEVVVTGTRTYTYPYTQIFNFRSINTDLIEERTSLNVDGNGITIIGLNNDTWWSTSVKEGERGAQILKPSTSYVFQIGKNIGVAKYGEFCK